MILMLMSLYLFIFCLNILWLPELKLEYWYIIWHNTLIRDALIAHVDRAFVMVDRALVMSHDCTYPMTNCALAATNRSAPQKSFVCLHAYLIHDLIIYLAFNLFRYMIMICSPNILCDWCQKAEKKLRRILILSLYYIYLCGELCA